MGAILSILKLEIKSYLTNTSALFWTFIYPILMLLLLIFVFSKNTTEIFYFNNIIGLMGLLIISSAIFGLTQAIASSRSHAIFVARIFQNEQSILGFANIINLYAVMSCNVFVSLDYLPNIGQLFIKTSIFYYLNQLLIKAFQGIDTILVLATSTFFIIGGIILFLLSANRMLLIPRERMR